MQDEFFSGLLVPSPEFNSIYAKRDLVAGQAPKPTLGEAIARIQKLIEWDAQIQRTNRQLSMGIRGIGEPFSPRTAMDRIQAAIADGGEARTALVAARFELADRLHYLDVVQELLFGSSRDLFNGADLAGWTTRLGQWEVHEERITNSGERFGSLQSKAQFSSFLLSVQWRWTGEPGDAAILLRNSGEDGPGKSELEVQLGHGRAGAILVGDLGQADSRSKRRVSRRTAGESPAVEWNTCVVALIDGQVAVWTNGRLVNNAAQIAERAGHICLQARGAPIEFRNIRITPLD